MEHEYDKILCCDRGDNDALLASMINSGNRSWDNPFIYLVWMMMAQRMWGNGWDGNAQNVEMQNQLQAIRTQLQDNQNSSLIMDAIKGNSFALNQLQSTINCDFNTLSAAICDVRNGITKLSGDIGFSTERVINAVNLGNCGITSALKDCCCATQKEILAQSNALQRGQDFINRSIERGFSTTAFQAQQDKCDMIRAGENNTQRIIDTLNNHWKDEQALTIQDLKFQLSQKEQNELLLSKMKGFMSGCGCNNGCSSF